VSFSNPTWNRRIIRTIGIISILLALLGGYFAVTEAPRILPRLHDSPAEPYVREAYCVMTVVDLCCLVGLTIGGVYLILLRRAGLIISNVVFAIEIAWFLLQASLPLLVVSAGGGYRPGASIGGAGGIGGLGTTPQMIIGYPVLALIFLNRARGGFPNESLRT
jgi:hypothetical protein